MAKGSVAKANVIAKMAEAFGENFVGEFDKKIYVWADDGGERVQIALSLTCPKTNIALVDAPVKPKELNFEEEAPKVVIAAKPADPSEEEQDQLAQLLSRLGL